MKRVLVTRRIWRVARELVLTTAAAVGVLCLVGSALMLATGVTPVVFRSGSMAPAMPTGALALVQDREARTVDVADVVSIIGGDGVRITHRVVDLRRASDGRMTLVTRGDANDVDDAAPHTVRRVDVVFWSAPGWGYAVAALQLPIVVFTGGVIAGSWVTWWVVTRRRRNDVIGIREPTTYSRPGSTQRSTPRSTPRSTSRSTPALTALALLTAAGLVGGGATLGAAESTRASFVDTASAASRFSVDKLGTRIARTRDSLRATNGTGGSLLGVTGQTVWRPFAPPPFKPKTLAAEGALSVAFDGTTFAQNYTGGSWQTRALPATGITAVAMSYRDSKPQVIVTTGSRWWVSAYPETSGTPGAWTLFQPTGAPTSIVDIDNSGFRLASTNGTEVRISEDSGRTWRLATAPGGRVNMLAYSGTTLLVWGSKGWLRSDDNGVSWIVDTPLTAVVARPTDIAGGNSTVAIGDNRFAVARGTSGIWRYSARSGTVESVGPAY
jgi:signal peptidase I